MLYFRSLASRGGVETFVVFLLWPKKMVEKSFVYIHSQAYFFYRLKFVFKKFSRKMWKLRFFSVSLTYIQRDCSISPSLHVFIRHSLGESSVNPTLQWSLHSSLALFGFSPIFSPSKYMYVCGPGNSMTRWVWEFWRILSIVLDKGYHMVLSGCFGYRCKRVTKIYISVLGLFSSVLAFTFLLQQN